MKKGVRLAVVAASAVVLLGLLYVGHCTGLLGDIPLLHYVFQCACPRFMENARIRKLYSEQAEIMFSACADVGPIPSPSGRKVAVIDYGHPDESYVWFLETDERVQFSWLDGNLDWLADDLLLVRTWRAANMVDLRTQTEHPMAVRMDVSLANGEIDPDVLAAMQQARYVVLADRMLAAVSPDSLASPQHTFVIPYEGFGQVLAECTSYGEMYERLREFLADEAIDYLDNVYAGGADVLANLHEGTELLSPDGRFLYRDSRSDELYLVETGERLWEYDLPDWRPIGWVYDGVLVRHAFGGFHLIDGLAFGTAPVELCLVRQPILKLTVPHEFVESEAAAHIK